MGRSRHGIIGPDDPTISYFSGVYSQFHRFIKEYISALQPDKHNRYVYCYNNPVNLIDPLGLDSDGTSETEEDLHQKSKEEQYGNTQDETAGSGIGSYLLQSLDQLICGNFTENVTLLGTAAQIVSGIFDLDLPADVRDISYDVTHWETSWSHAGQTALDVIGLIPLIGALKYADEGIAAIKGAKHLDEGADLATATRRATRIADDIEMPSGRTGYRYVGPGEADLVENSGKIPNWMPGPGGERVPKDIFYTDMKYESAFEAAKDLEINTPTHRIEFDLNGTRANYGGLTSGGAPEFTTRIPIPAQRVVPLMEP